MTIAFVCPDSFKDYEFAKRELSTIDSIQNIICATSNSARLMEAYVSECNDIKYRHEKRSGKQARIRRMIKDADKVMLIEYTDHNRKRVKYSRTQIALDYIKETGKELQFIEYNRTEEAKYKDKAKLLEEIEDFCLPSDYLYKERYKHPLSQARPELRNDEEIVLFAVERYGFAFDFASRQLQEDKSAVIRALHICMEAFPYAYEKLRKESEVLEVLQKCESKKKEAVPIFNATYLFNQPTGGFHHSESRWSSIAQMAFIWLSQKQEGLTVFKSTITDNRKNWLKKSSNELSFENWTISNTIVEGQIKYIFDKNPLINSPMKPDIVWVNQQVKKIILIEVKTVGATVIGSCKENQDQVDRYRNLVSNLSIDGWKCELYYLMSYGHEDESKKHTDWIRLQKDNANILLWEELFSKIEQSEIAPYIHPNLKQYTLMPEWI